MKSTLHIKININFAHLYVESSITHIKIEHQWNIRNVFRQGVT